VSFRAQKLDRLPLYILVRHQFQLATRSCG
jgi:hypothetical protein